MKRQLIPGESYTTDLVFDLPPTQPTCGSCLRATIIETPFLIGHENSLFHGKTTFRLSV